MYARRMRLASGVVASLLVVVTSFAVATPQATETQVHLLVQSHLALTARMSGNDQLLLTKDALVNVRGLDLSSDTDDFPISDSVLHSLNRITRKLGKLTTGANDATGVGWFQWEYQAHITFESAINSMPDVYDVKERVGGLAVRDGTTWKLAAVQYSDLKSDAALLADKQNRREALPAQAKLTGDATIAKTVAEWYATGFASNAAGSPNIVVSGSSPGEYAKGAATAKLVKGWDKLKLVVDTLEARSYAGGKAAAVRGVVVWPSKKGKGGTLLHVLVVLVHDGTQWKWVSIQYGA